MVVGKLITRWSPWAPPPVPKQRYLVRLHVARLEGFSVAIAGESRAVVAVGVRWRGPPKGRGIPYLHRRRREIRSGGVSEEAAVGITGDVEWIRGEENEFEKVCCFSGGGGPFSLWEISFSVLFGSGALGKEGRERKLLEVGSAVINLGQWAWDFHVQKQCGGFEGKESHFYAERKQFPITVSKDNLTAEVTLHVDVSFIEIETPKEILQVATYEDQLAKGTQQEEGLDSSDGFATDDPCSSSDMDMDVSQLFPIAHNEEKTIRSKSRRKSSSSHSSSSNSGNSSPELQLLSVSKRRFLPWGSKSRAKKISEEKINKETSPVNNLTNGILSTEPPEFKENDDPIGKWESKEFISRDKRTKLKAQSFFASIDQRDESADGESACTALVAVIANALHSSGANTLTRYEFDSLIREGSSQWRRLCDNPSCIERFPNKHFDLETILEAKINSTSVLQEKSFIGFFQPESFESLQGAMSFDDIWNAISNDVEDVPKIYIISWNDHFFVLMLESEAYYIIDTLGERLFEGFKQAYMLRFDESTEIYKLPVVEEDKVKAENEEFEELISSGKDCCREFIKRFFAAIPVREEIELLERGKGNANTVLHQRLQIELHYTVTCCNVSNL
ncbi:uncharacterized protein LOC110107906 [Dendrobium catenatum]|uniref:uncharacterized protein LOC110107906 n=1 Tax=Dendrobium catenatum TaxID=906689 RepID=UPI0010A04B50|nr:uncharacterized protein LOC110107906 [Dendrobium catenatum]